ncbi:MAG TPA: HEAT repeat domain-containing protein [Pyrinomonadaceae bacterium]|nr:HEAT repeat domain-containing protein [Pyrinomonadaceae bacterium]
MPAQESRKSPAPSSPTQESPQPQPRTRAAKEIAAADSSQSAFGAYRIDQEVGKLVLGKPHRMDVMASRVSDDRRAIEASLIKALSASDVDEAGRERARRALEDYGFVARQCALMLQGRDAWERSSAARVLGQISSAASLPALIEALHDADSVVRNQAVTSLGQSKQPVAIGALLDIARRHSDIPPALLSESLSACSVDDLSFLDSAPFDFNEPQPNVDGDPQEVDAMLSSEQLPMGDEDDALLGLLTRLESSDTGERAQVARELASHRAQRSVSALCSTAMHDPDASVRAAAVAGLGNIDHESVFAPVLISLADDTREVRAAAARSLSSLHFDRAQAYARVMKSADLQTLQTFAQACVKTGIAAQAVDRLASEDRRHAQEAFALFSVLAKAGEVEPILEIIATHPDVQVKLAAVRVLSVAGSSDAAPKLRELVATEGMPEDVRTSILELLYKFDKEPTAV